MTGFLRGFPLTSGTARLGVLLACGLALGACGGGGVAATRSPSGASGSPSPSTSGAPGTTGAGTSVSSSSTSSSSSSTSTSPSTTATSGTSASAPASSLPTNGGVEACTASHLALSLGQPQGTAGSTIVPLVFTNTGSVPCEMYGYPGVSLAKGPSGPQVGTAAVRDRAVTPAVVTLAAGARASAALQIAEAGNYSAATCQPSAASGLRVFAPGDTTALYVAEPNLQGCAATGVDLLTVQPVTSPSGTTGAG